MSEIQQQQDSSRRVQEKIKLMIKQKKMHKLASEKQFNDKPISIQCDKTTSKFQDISQKNKKLHRPLINYKEDEYPFATFSTNRIKGIIDSQDVGISASFTMKENVRKVGWRKDKTQLYESSNNFKKIPSQERIETAQQQQTNKQSARKLKRPSSVVNKSTRATTSRTLTRKKTLLQLGEQKQLEEKIRQIVPKCFQTGMKLEKFTQQNRLDLNEEYQLLMSEQLNVIKLINNSRKYYSREDKEEDQDAKLTNGVEKQIIEILKKKNQKLKVINKCDKITNQIANLIDARLSALTISRKNIG